ARTARASAGRSSPSSRRATSTKSDYWSSSRSGASAAGEPGPPRRTPPPNRSETFQQQPPALKRRLLDQILEIAASHNYVFLEAQARRGLALAARDPQELARAVAKFDRIGAVPC